VSKTLSIGKAKPQLCDLVEQARNGQTHIITVHDVPAAQIGPVQDPAQKLTEAWRQRVKKEKILLNPPGKKRLTISQLIREGRK
jgi:antitoxin (DNA-binding transcriptional repressor) of toxin-antitoxin stability system